MKTDKDVKFLLRCGKILDKKIRGITFRELLCSALLRIRDKNGKLVPLRANDVQKDFSSSCGKRSIILKARQMGISTWVAARFFIHIITHQGALAVEVAHTQSSAEQLFKIVHRFWANLPKWLREGALKPSRANVRQIVFPLLDSEYRVETAADPDAGRGLTIHCLHASEVARWPRDPHETLASLRAALVPDGEEVLESTPNGAHGVFYQAWQQAEETGHVRHFYPWWKERGYRLTTDGLGELTEEEQVLIHEHKLDAEQVAYRRSLKKRFGNLAPQEFAEDAESCFLASGDCCFDLTAIDARMDEVMAGDMPEERDKLTMFCPPLERRQYIIGVDTSSGGNRSDFACAQVIDRISGMQCAELHGHLPPVEFAARLIKLAKQYNDALLAVEVNQHGNGVVSLLQHLHRWHNLYHGKNGAAGFVTDGASRPALITAIGTVLICAPEMFVSPRLLREMRTFVRDSAGRPAAAPGCHDDTVMAMAIALHVRDLTAGK